MPTAAIGIAYLDDVDGCAEAAAWVGALTHDDLRATQACQIWSHAIRHAVLSGTFDGVRGYLDRVGGEAAHYWRPLLAEAESGAPQDSPKNGWVVHAVQTAWWAITAEQRAAHGTCPQHWSLAVRAGGDTDTTAAIAGALLGARLGATAVPVAWRRMLHGWPGMDAAVLVRLAVRTANSGQDGPGGRSSTSTATI